MNELMENIDDNPEEGNDNERLTTADMAGASAAPTRARTGAEKNEMRQEPAAQSEEGFEPLFDKGEAEEFRSRWYAIQTGFVDEPRKAVQEADELVAAVMKRLAEVFAGERERLERDWDQGDDISTEDLRVALRRYRSFFDRLLAV